MIITTMITPMIAPGTITGSLIDTHGRKDG